MIKVVNFIKCNHQKKLTIAVWFWAGIFRAIILFVPTKYSKKLYGIAGEESPQSESEVNYKKAGRISYHVNRVAEHTPWESKCLVRALTAQKLLSMEKVTSTLYLGVKKIDDRMVAHSWLRTGEFYVTGGSGEDYAVVAKFRR